MANNKNNTLENIFGVSEEATQTTTRGIPAAQELGNASRELTMDLFKKMTKDAELGSKVSDAVNTGEYQPMVDVLNSVFDEASFKLAVLDSITEDEQKRLLESRRSDRSKTKKAGFKTLEDYRRYISAVIAEMMVRNALGLTYKSSTAGVSYDIDELAQDQDALNRKIRSLQSKVSVLRKDIQYKPDNWPGHTIIKSTEAEIEELKARRISTHTTATKTVSMKAVQNSIAAMSAEEREELLATIAAMQSL